MKALLEAKQLSCVRQQKPLFQKLDFALHESGVLLIEGPNGSGKSSLLRLVTGLSTPSEGEIYWQGESISALKSEYWRNLHFCGHTNGIKSGLTVAENLELAKHLSQSRECGARDVLQELNLHQVLHTNARYLSAGQKRRLALAKFFIYPKKLWIMDEPLTALDAAGQELFFHKLQNHLHAGGMAVISSHHPLHLPHACAQHVRLGL